MKTGGTGAIPSSIYFIQIQILKIIEEMARLLFSNGKHRKRRKGLK